MDNDNTLDEYEQCWIKMKEDKKKAAVKAKQDEQAAKLKAL